MTIFSNLKLIEGTFQELLKLFQDRDFILATAFRNEFTLEENRERNNDLIDTFLEPIKLDCMVLKNHFQKHNEETGEDIKVREESLFIARPARVNTEGFKSLAKAIIKKYSQDSIFIKIGADVGFLKQDGSITQRIGKLRFGRFTQEEVERGYSALGKHNFVFEGSASPNSVMTAQEIASYGIVWINSYYFRDIDNPVRMRTEIGENGKGFLSPLGNKHGSVSGWYYKNDEEKRII